VPASKACGWSTTETVTALVLVSVPSLATTLIEYELFVS